MSDEDKVPGNGVDAKDAADTAAPEADARAADTAAGQPPADSASEIYRLEAEVAAMKDKYLRAFAEAENIRRRAEREVADAKTYGVSSFARDMLNVADDLARALSTVDDQAKADADGPLKALLEGLELTQRGLERSLEKQGIRRIEPRGEKFDPNLHQAMFEVPDASVPNGTVVQVVQAGYVIGERVLRPAMVGVSRGGPKGEAPATSTAA